MRGISTSSLRQSPLARAVLQTPCLQLPRHLKRLVRDDLIANHNIIKPFKRHTTLHTLPHLVHILLQMLERLNRAWY